MVTDYQLDLCMYYYINFTELTYKSLLDLASLAKQVLTRYKFFLLYGQFSVLRTNGEKTLRIIFLTSNRDFLVF